MNSILEYNYYYYGDVSHAFQIASSAVKCGQINKNATEQMRAVISKLKLLS